MMVATLTIQELDSPAREPHTPTAQHPAPIVVVGNGPVGFRFLERLVARRREACATDLARHDQRPIIVFGEEPHLAYDRVNLTSYFDNPSPEHLRFQELDWYEQNNIELRTGDPIESIDRETRTVQSRSGDQVTYGSLVLATGSRPFVPPIDGVGQDGVFVYRTIDDLDRIQQAESGSRTAAVLGGGLLGLEAARALMQLGLETHVVEMAPVLMPRQLDTAGANLLRGMIDQLGVHTHVHRHTERITRTDKGLRLEFRDDLSLTVDMVVISAGIRPRDELARESGLNIGERGGIVVDQQLRTSDPNIYAIGECASFDGTVFGLAAPGYLMAVIAADNASGAEATFTGSDESTRLKLLGVDVTLCGDYLDISECKTLIHETSTTYRKLILRQNRLIGAVAVGPFPELPRIQECISKRRFVFPWQSRRFVRDGNLWEDPEAEDVTAWPAGSIVCSCKGITRGELTAACNRGCDSIEAIAGDTQASTVCGSCKPLIASLLSSDAAPVESVPGWRWLLGASIVATLLVPLILILGPIPFATSVQDGFYQLDVIWRDTFWRQVTGFTLLSVVGLALLLSLRKRWQRVSFLNFGLWRSAHGVLGLATLLGIVVHTGMHLGSNLNFWLMTSFLGINFAGGMTGAIAAIENKATGRLQRSIRRWRPRLTLIHILCFWPFPILIAFHIAAVYYL